MSKSRLKFTLEEVKEMIIRFSEINKAKPSINALKKEYPNFPTNQGSLSFYGMSLQDIIDSCNIKYEFFHKPLTYTDDELINFYKLAVEQVGRIPTKSDFENLRKTNNELPSFNTIIKRIRNIENMFNAPDKNKGKYGKYKEEFLISELKRYYQEFGVVPTQTEIDKNKDYPSRKSFSSLFKSYNNALRAAGFDVKDTPIYTKEYLISEIMRFIDEFGRQPFSADMDNTKSYPSKNIFMREFGSWNNAVRAAGLKARVSHYTDEELKEAFLKFVNINNRPPILHEFNNDPEYPSFWCYQNRFGSWNKTLIAYGFSPNEGASGARYEFDNGEICTSSFEFDTSTWLRENKISYLRNVPYKDILHDYDGKKDCDYVIIHNGEFIWLEIAGLYTTREKKSSMEKDYIERFDHKLENLLSQFNYRVFYPDDFRNKMLDEQFSFLNEIESRPWFDNEPIYQGVSE